MKKKGLIVIAGVILIVIFVIFAVTLNNKYDFRKTNWGMTIEEVSKTESAVNTSSKSNELYYRLSDNYLLEGILTHTIYEFTGENHTLSKVRIGIFGDEFDTDYFLELVRTFKEEYGECVSQKGAFEFVWEVDDTRITLYCLTDGSIEVTYEYVEK